MADNVNKEAEDTDPFKDFDTQVYDNDGVLVEDDADESSEDDSEAEDESEADDGETEDESEAEDAGGDDGSSETQDENEEGAEEDVEDEDEDVEEDDADKDEEKPEKKNRRSFKDRANQLTKQYRDAQRRAETAEASLAAVNARLDSLEKGLPADKNNAKEETTDSGGKPNPEKYTYGELDPDYISDLTDFRVDQKLKARDADSEKQRQSDAAAQRAKTVTKQYNTVKENGAKAYKDFDSVVVQGADNEEYKLSESTAELLLNSPVGHHVAYKLAKNPKLADRLAQLGPIPGAVEFGRLEAQFLGKKKLPKPKIPNTDPPMTTRRGKKGAKETKHDTSDFAAFEKKVMSEKHS